MVQLSDSGLVGKGNIVSTMPIRAQCAVGAQSGAPVGRRSPICFPSGVVAAELRAPGEARCLLARGGSERRAAPCRSGSRSSRPAGCARGAPSREFGRSLISRSRSRPIGSPLWPESLVGSITHTLGLCAAVVAERARLRGARRRYARSSAASSRSFGRDLRRGGKSLARCLAARRAGGRVTLIFPPRRRSTNASIRWLASG